MPRPPAHDTAALLQDLADIWRCKVADLSCGKETLLQRLWAGCVCSVADGPGHQLVQMVIKNARSTQQLACCQIRLDPRVRGRYGTVNEVTVRRKDTGTSHAVVIKRVRPPAGSGVSHTRKLKSYQARTGGLNDVALLPVVPLISVEQLRATP